MTASALLREARARIAAPGGWSPRIFAQDAAHRAVRVRDPGAVCWSGLTALMARQPGPHFDAALGALQRAANSRSFGDWEDAPGRTQTEVVEAFDRALGAVEGRRQECA